MQKFCSVAGWRIAMFATFISLSSAQSQPGKALPAKAMSNTAPWWKHAVIYEVYPRSFADSDGDGLGDLNGITQHLEYLSQVGVDAIWLTPIYPSPQVDFGYDISDYKAIDPRYGSFADFDRLVAEAKKKRIKVVMDMVLNHTSDQSAWFRESASSRTNAKADWYVWNDGISASSAGLDDNQKQNVHTGPAGEVVPPNNWRSFFGGSAWTWVPARQQFYYHKFYAEQPDLNWRNPQVEAAMFDIMQFWLDRDVSGFRLDAITTLFEDKQLRNDPDARNPFARGYTWGLPEIHGVLRRLRSMVDTYPGQRVLIGELNEPTPKELDIWYGGPSGDELQLPMDYFYGFPSFSGQGPARTDRLDANFYRQRLLATARDLKRKRPLIFFDNHDNPRSMDRFSDGVHDKEIAKVVATLLFAPAAVAQTYYGAEIGMVTTPPTRREDVQDPVGRAAWPENKGRDGERTPMQWTPGPQAGFSSNPKTWLPIPRSANRTNVEAEMSDPTSLLNWYRSLIRLRRSLPALRDGGIRMIDESNPEVLSFIRTGNKPVLVVMNMTAHPATASLHLKVSGFQGSPHLLLATPGMRKELDSDKLELLPYAVMLAKLE